MLRIDNGVYTMIEPFPWDDTTLPLKAGTPMSEAGVVANGSTAIGIVPETVSVRPPVGGLRLLVGGDVIRMEVEASYGETLSDDALEAMNGIRFYNELGRPERIQQESGGGGETTHAVLVATITVLVDGDVTSYTMDKTVGEIITAMAAGTPVFALLSLLDNAPPSVYLTPLTVVIYDEEHSRYSVPAVILDGSDQMPTLPFTAATLNDYPAYSYGAFE